MEVMSSSMELVVLETFTPARKDSNARRNGVELVFAIFRCNFCVALTRTAITFAYELGLERSLARCKANEKLHLKIAKTSSTPFRRAFESFRTGVKLSRTTSSIEEDITSKYTPNIPHSGSEPMPLQGPITRARARQF